MRMARFFEYAFDALAGTVLGAAVCYAVASVFQWPILVAASMGGLVFVRVFASLIRLPRPDASPAFVPIALTFEEETELLLDEPLAAPPQASRVVRLFGSMQTPCEMREAIERHLGVQSQAAQPAPDATEDLREALAQLRRSVG